MASKIESELASTESTEPADAPASESAPTNPRWPLWAAMLLSLGGIALALYASYQTLFLRWQGLVNPSGCTLNAFVNCDAVLASSYAFLAGVPVAWWGAFFYLWMLLLATWAAFRQGKNQVSLFVGLISSLAGAVFSLYKAYTLFFTLRLLCPVCVGMYLVNFTLVWLFLKAQGAGWRTAPRAILETVTGNRLSIRHKQLVRGLALSALILAVLLSAGYSLADYIETDIIKLPQIDVAAEVKKHFEQEPRKLRVHPAAPVWGNPDAPVEIVEFSDFQCSHCKHAAFHLRGLLWEFRDQVKFVYMNFPLDPKINRFIRVNVHPFAGLAARAAVCAQKRGKFWEFHDDLFKNQKRFSRELMLDLAEKYGWDRQEFARDLEARTTYGRVRTEIEYAGPQIRSTPSLFINGRRVRSWRHPEIVQEIIREEIRRSGKP